MSKDLMAEILKLSPSERIQLVEDIWESFSPEEMEMTDEQLKELEARVARADRNPEKSVAWDELKERAKKELLASR